MSNNLKKFIFLSTIFLFLFLITPDVKAMELDNINGFVFNIDNANELAEKMLYLYENKNKAKEIGECGRKIYDEYFTYEKFAINLDKIVNEVIDKNNK